MTMASKVQVRSEALRIIAGLWDRVLRKESTYWDELQRASEAATACKEVLEKLVSILTCESDFGEFFKLPAEYVKPWSREEGVLSRARKHRAV
jgi:hypothetical protein